jgi:hypothetical protein
MSSNPLEEIWEDYTATKDCFRIAQEVVRAKEYRFLKKTDFVSDTQEHTEKTIIKNRNKSDEFFILALWVVFERYIISFFQRKGMVLKEITPELFANGFYVKFENEIERWRIEDILDILKNVINPDFIGHAKNIKKYRDWIAHKNPNKPTPSKIDPKLAYSVLNKIITTVELVDYIERT